jgi:hypothetical protein
VCANKVDPKNANGCGSSEYLDGAQITAPCRRPYIIIFSERAPLKKLCYVILSRGGFSVIPFYSHHNRTLSNKKEKERVRLRLHVPSSRQMTVRRHSRAVQGMVNSSACVRELIISNLRHSRAGIIRIIHSFSHFISCHRIILVY